MKPRPRKFALVYVAGGVGNAIMATPAMRVLADMGYVVDCFADPHQVYLFGIIAGLPFVRHTYTGPRPRQLYDLILMSPLRPPAHWPLSWRDLLREGGRLTEAPRPIEQQELHESVLFCSPLKELGWNGDLPQPEIVATPILKGRHVVLFPDCKPERAWWIKRWTTEKWIELSLRVKAEGFVPVALADDQEITSWAREGRALDLGGLTSLREAAGIIAGSRAAVGIDNGLSHIAAAVGVPLIVLWGPASWIKNKPLGPSPVSQVGPTKDCSPCQYGRWDSWPTSVSCARPAPPCMEQTVDEVFGALKELL